MGLIQVIRDWSLVKKQKEGLLDALRQTPPGAGISVSNPHDPIMARAIIELLKEHAGKLEIIDHGFSVNIMRKIGMTQSMSAEMYAELKAKHDILDGEAIVNLGLGNTDTLPSRRWRGGVPDDVNGDPNADPFEVVEAKRKAGMKVD